jgi:hypothetical protein
MDSILKKYDKKIDSFTYVTFVSDRISKKYSPRSPYIGDSTRLLQYDIGIYGVLPDIFDTGANEFLSVSSQESGLPLGEQLYSARGT